MDNLKAYSDGVHRVTSHLAASKLGLEIFIYDKVNYSCKALFGVW